MGPAFANLLEIGGDQYEYIQSSIVNDLVWYTCGYQTIYNSRWYQLYIIIRGVILDFFILTND